jgi:hypothetical protein
MAVEKKSNPNVELPSANVEQELLTRNIGKISGFVDSNPDLFNYGTIRMVNGDGAQIVNRLRGINDLQVFHKLKNSVLSLLQPKVRIYKVVQDLPSTTEGGGIDFGKSVNNLGERYREIKFSDTIGVERVATVQDYLKYESSKPSWRNVGLKSFRFQNDASSFGGIEQNIECNLEITLKSLKDIEAQPPGEPLPEQGGVRYADLIVYPGSRKTRQADIYNPRYYRIKAFIGYTAPDIDSLRALNLSKSEIEAVRDIEKFNIVVALDMNDYVFNIGDDGLVNLSITYRGAVENTFSNNQASVFSNIVTRGAGRSGNAVARGSEHKSDILDVKSTFEEICREIRDPACKDSTCEAIASLKNLIEEDELFAEVLKDRFPKLKRGETFAGIILGSKTKKLKIVNMAKTQKYFKFPKTQTIVQDAIKERVGDYRKQIYKSFLSAMIDGNQNAGGSRLFCLETDFSGGIAEDVAAIAGAQEDAAVRRRDRAFSQRLAQSDDQEDAINKLSENWDPSSYSVKVLRADPGTDDNEVLRRAADADADYQAEARSRSGTVQEVLEDIPRVVSSDKSKHRFFFMYLGDIIELACKNAGLSKIDFGNAGNLIFDENTYFSEEKATGKYPFKGSRMLIGPIEYRDTSGRISTVNLAKVPVSFNLFRAWFTKKIVRSQRTHMPLGFFLNDLIKDLVMPGFEDAMSMNYRAPRTRHSFMSLTLPGRRAENGKLEELMPKKQALDTDSSEFRRNYIEKMNKIGYSSESLVKNSFDYLYLSVSTSKDITKRKGDPIEDAKEGIYHFNIGSDVGLLKDVTFSRVAIPGLAVARAMDSADMGADSLNQIKFPHNADLKLVGNTLFTPGMYYYVNPGLAGLGSIEDSTSMAFKMQLGGYHLITKMSIVISPGFFETSLSGFQQGINRKRK